MGKLKKNVRILLTLFFMAGVALRPAAVQAQTLRFTRLTAEDGLSHDAVSCILQDAQGFMWFGTLDGLNQYDGYTFTIYRRHSSDPASLADNTINTLYEDSTGTLWVGTVVGLDSFDRAANRFHHYPAVSEAVSAIYEDRANNLWIGTQGAGLFKYDRVKGEFLQYQHDPARQQSLSDDNVMAIYEDGEGTLWVGTWNGLNAFDLTAQQFTQYRSDPTNPYSLSHDMVTAILEDRSGALWVGTGSDHEAEVGGLNRLDRTTGQFTHYRHAPDNSHSLSHNHVTALLQDQAGALWVGTETGLDVFDPTTQAFNRHSHDPLDTHSLGRGRVTTLYKDHSGILWVGTRDGGVSKYAPAKDRFVRYQHDPLDPNSLSGESIGALYKDHTGIVWIGIHDGGLDRLDRTTNQFTHYTHTPDDPYSLGSDHVTALYEDHEGVLWVGTSAGLDRFDRATGRFTHYAHDPADVHSLCPGEVKVIIEDQSGALWIATEGPGALGRLSMADGSVVCYQNDPANPSSLPDTYGVRALYQDRSGGLWMGTYNGLIHLDPGTETFTQYRHDPADAGRAVRHSLSHDFVWSIYQDQQGTLWVGTHGGLNRFDQASGQFTVYTMENGLPNDAVSAVLGDAQGYLWLGTIGGGVSRFDPRSGTFRNYSVSDGLQSNTVLIGAYHQSADGEMFFGGPNGFNTFYPADIQDNPHLPPVLLTAFRKFDQVVKFDADLSKVREIRLSYQDNFFAFEFAALDYTDPARNQYAYRLEGFDRDWIYCGARRYASYTNLPPGTYTFHVKGANNDGVWNEAGQTVRIVVTPPFWQTWWFRILAFALVSGVIAVVVRRRLRNIAVLRESEERFRTLFESAPLCVFELDVSQRPLHILRANRQSEGVFGWPAAELAAVPIERIFPQQARPTLERVAESLRTGETITVESTGLRRDGAEFPARISAAREPGQGRAIVVVEDITAERERRSEEQAIAEERRRIAHEIHDGLAQDLAGLRLKVRWWHSLVDESPVQMHAELDGLQKLLAQQIRQVRRSIFALRPVALDEQGFWPALHQFVAEFGEQNQLHVDLQVAGPTERLPAFLELVLFRIIQESLNNVSKHAAASMAWIELDLQSAAAVTLRVRDDGVGIDPAILADAVRQGHFGLKQMRERVKDLRGTFDLRAQPGVGVEICIVLPL